MLKSLMIALALSSLSLPAFAASSVPAPIACPTAQDLYDVQNAWDLKDAKAVARLVGPVCSPLVGVRYRIEEAANGVTTIRVFPKDGNWANSHLEYTFDDMIPADDKDLFCEENTPEGAKTSHC